jgi:hypothetical protein
MLQKSSKAFLEGASTAIIAHIAAWLVRIPTDKLYHKVLYLIGHIAVTVVVTQTLGNR